MVKLTARRSGVMAIALLVGLAWVGDASAAGAVNIDTCQTLNSANTVYKVTADLSSAGDCLIVAANKITIDLQSHSVTGTTGGNAGISDQGSSFDVIVVKNGAVGGYAVGVFLASSTRVTVLAVTANENRDFGIRTGDQSLVKSSTASFNDVHGIFVGDHSQVQQCVANNNGSDGIVAGNNCLVTMNTANNNGEEGITTLGNCTVSFNTANDNSDDGIDAGGDEGTSGNLVTQNTATGNGDIDFHVACPSTVTFNTSSSGFPSSYDLGGSGCHTGNNN